MKYTIKIILLLLVVTFSIEAEEIQLTGTLRDFHSSHPDFQLHDVYHNWNFAGLDQGIVENQLGADKKPIYNGSFWSGTKSTSNEANFNQWYRDVSGINQSMDYTITLQKQGSVYVYDSEVNPVGDTGTSHDGFFPLDHQLFGNEENSEHNYHLTYEVHSSFTYQGGEIFEFSGDDDVWVFINGQLVIDIGGVHSRIEDSVNLDTLNLTVGESYDFDMFWAERHTVESNFKITTSIELDSQGDCTEETQTIQRVVSSDNDDAEERVSNGDMYRSSSDLEMTQESHRQIIGIRFRDISIPKNAIITNAYIQFATDETDSESTNLTIHGEDSDNALAFSGADYDISSRPKTSSSISWSPPAWNSVGEQGSKQRTGDLSSVVQEIVNRGGWSKNNSMAFIISGTGKRVADSYHGTAPYLHIEYMGCPQENNSSSTAMCYALTDNSDRLYKVTMSPNGDPLPTPTIVNISQTFNGEGSAYRASDNKFYAFKANSDDHGPSDLYTIDVDTGATQKIVDNIISGAVDGAEFYFDPTLNKEILYIISGEYHSKLYAFDPDGWTPLAGYPKNTNTNLSSLAINPITGDAYAIDDYNYDNQQPKVYTLNLKTGATTHITTLQNLADAEGLAYASDGNLYIEDEGRDDLEGKKLYMVNLQTGELTPSAFTNANGDIEGLSCNGTQMAIEYPTIKIDANSSVVEGNSNTTDLNFLVTLSKPAVEDIILSYAITDETTVAGEDYIVESNKSIIIPKDAESATITIKIKGDEEVENNETFIINLIDAQNGVIDNSGMRGTIINDDSLCKVSIFDANVTEGDSGTTEITFDITLDKPAPNGGLTIQIEPTDITANEGEDYTRVTSSIYFAQNETNKTISYLVNGDTDIEDNETFSIDILQSESFDIDPLNASAIGTIINDDEETPLPIAEYRFDECFWDGSVDEVKDSSSNGYHGKAIHGATTQKEHKINRSAIFKEVNKRYVTIDGFDDIWGVGNNAFTVTAWIKPNSLSTHKTNHGTSNTFLAKASDPYNDNIEIGVNSNGTLHLYLDTDTKDTAHNFGESGDIDTNSWHFIAISYKDGEATVTIDNKTYTDNSTWSGANHIDQALHSPLTIGASIHVDDFFNGSVDEVKIFSTSLKSSQISEIFNNEKNGINWDGTARESDDCAIEPTGCIASAFMFQGRTNVYALNLANGDMPQVQSEPINIDNINAVGFNKKDNFFWGYNYDKKDGTIAKIGLLPNGKWGTEEFKIAGLDGFISYVGDIDNSGHLYLKESSASKRVVVIDLDSNSSTYLTKIKDFTITSNLSTADWAFNPKDNMLYAVNNGGGTKYLYKIDPTNGAIVYQKNTNLTGNRGFGAGFFDANGFYYVYDNSTGEIFRIDVANSPIAVLFSTARVVSLNDGAMCTDVEFRFDFGDLPDTYHTTLEHNGARHSFPPYGEPTTYLGTRVDSENNGKPSLNALGDDDEDDEDDEDGVKIDGVPLDNNITIDAGTTINLEITTHGEGYLNAWIDWNGDGDFDDTNEQIATNIGANNNIISLNITTPLSYDEDRKIYARFRYSLEQDLAPTGNAIDGEVEDYMFHLKGGFEPFECTDKLYLSNYEDNMTSLQEIIRPTFLYNYLGYGYQSSTHGYNAIGYNIQDNYIYALDKNKLLKISNDGNIKNLGVVVGLPNEQLYAGEFDRDGYYYVTGSGSDDNTMYKIDVTQKEVIETITLSRAIRFWDMAIDITGEYFYAMLIGDGDSDSDFNNDRFAKIEISTGEITTVGESHADLPSYISLIFSDVEGKIVALSNDNGFYEILPNSGNIYYIQPSHTLGFYNDGTSCPDANITLPPHPPRLSINSVSQAEGNDGETIFNFTVTADKPFSMMPMSGAMFYYKVVDGNGSEIQPPHGVALSSDNDFEAKSGIGMGFNMFGDGVEINLPVTVYGDTKVEKDEEFYVEIYSPQMPVMTTPKFMIDKSRGVGLILNDDMKIRVERPSSASGDLSNLYTQISGRDFDYSVVSYNETNEPQLIGEMTFKVKLLDDENSTLYTGYAYMDSNQSRVDITLDNDLNITTATRNAHFELWHLKDVNGSILRGNYSSESSYNMMLESGNIDTPLGDTSDHFAIRPASFRIEIGDRDGNNTFFLYGTNKSPINNSARLASEYNYSLKAKAMMENNNTILTNYRANSEELNITLVFDDNISGCKDMNNTVKNGYSFTNGQLDEYISHNNVGKYLLHIEDTNWTFRDKNQQEKGCIENNASNTPNSDGKIGCNIASNQGEDFFDMPMIFQPYKFEFKNTTLSNINNNGKDYLYMSNLNDSQEMGAKLSTMIVAKGKNNSTLSNFKKHCAADGILSLSLIYDGFTDDDNFSSSEEKNITSNGNNVIPQNMMKFGEQSDYEFKPFNKDLNISAKEAFIEDGIADVNIIYNLKKEFLSSNNKPMNPIRVNFLKLDVNSTEIENNITNKTIAPYGEGDINDTRTFYFARVVSYLEHYPETEKRVIDTPLFAEIFCKIPNNRAWCDETMSMSSIGMNISQKTDRGWYRAKEHNGNIDGEIIALVSPNSDINITYQDLKSFNKGRVDNIKVIYNGDDEITATIRIYTDIWLGLKQDDTNNTLSLSSYTVTIKNPSSTTGAGNAGGLVNRVQKVEHNGKMSW